MEKLYNNIILDDNFSSAPSDAENVPYLKNPPDIIDVTVGRQLFVDDFLIEQTTLSYRYHKAKKFEANPIFFPTTEWEKEISPVACPKSGGVFYDEEEKTFKMWYEAGWLNKMCYATSKDGISWERPSLDVVEGTNIILPCNFAATDEFAEFTGDISYLRSDSTTVFFDRSAPKEERYKLFLRNPGPNFPAIIGVSSDGIHFEKLGYTGVVDDRSTAFYNPFRKKWVFSIRSQTWDGKFERSRYYYECDNFLDGKKWNENARRPWMRIDKLDKPHPAIGAPPQLYNVDCVGYESIMLGMFQIHYGPRNNDCAKNGMPKITELMPMYSRDGYHFSRPSRESFIGADANSWDKGYVQSVGGVCIINGDELWIYYIAFSGDQSKKHDEECRYNGMYCNGATGIAKLRRDGFVSMNGNGKLLTKKLQFFGKSAMYINAVGTVRASIIDEYGNILAKSSIFSGDSTKAELIFDKLNISDLNEKIFRIAFDVNGSLYSFGFTDENGDFGGAHAAGIVH